MKEPSARIYILYKVLFGYLGIVCCARLWLSDWGGCAEKLLFLGAFVCSRTPQHLSRAYNKHTHNTHNAPAFSGRPTSHRAVPKRHHPSLIAETHVRSRVAFNQSSLRANRLVVVRGRCTRGEGERGCTTTKTTTAHANRFDGWNDQSRNDRNLYEFNRNDRSRCRSVRVRCERIEERIGAVGFAKGELYIAYLNVLMTFFYIQMDYF